MVIEIVCCSVEDCLIAESQGADRIELCAGLEVGGLTPSLGVVQEALSRVNLPIMVMVRPRGGGFYYQEEDFKAMLRDVRLLREAGADGIVTGFLRPEGHLDLERLEEVVAEAGDMQIMHHRAFDVVPDSFEALEQLIELKVTRILTSGRKPTAWEGRELLKQLHERADGRIEINPAGGIRAANAAELAAYTRIPRLHLAPFEFVAETSCGANPEIDFSGLSATPNHTRARTDGKEIRQLKTLI